MIHRVALALGCALAVACCGGSIKRPYAKPSVPDVLTDVRAHEQKAASFQAESTMDYWVGKNRVKGTVLLLGKPGRRLRFNALNPTGGNVAVDLACDGTGYKLIDYNNNCQMTGPCTRETIAHFLGVELDPDDFYLLATGTIPLIPNPKGTLSWDAKNAREKVELASADGLWKQEIQLDGRDHHWDVLSSTVFDKRGDIEWKVENKGFHEVKAADGSVFRAPSKTKFVQPKYDADLLVVWKSYQFNLELGPQKFDMQIPQGLATCQQQPPSANVPAP